MLGCPGAGVLLRLQRRERLAERVFGLAQRCSSPSLGQTATDPGTVDASASIDGQYLYVQTGGNGIVDEFHVNANGSLTAIGSVTVAGAVGGEGIVAF